MQEEFEFGTLNEVQRLTILRKQLKDILATVYGAALTQLPDNKKSRIIKDQIVTLDHLFEDYFGDLNKNLLPDA